MLTITPTNIPPTNFKADSIAAAKTNRNQGIPPIPQDMNDMFIMPDMVDNQALKKQKKQERLNAMSAYGTIAIAVALLTGAIASLIGMRQNAKINEKILKDTMKGFDESVKGGKKSDKIFNVEFENLSKNNNIANIRTTKTLSEKVQRFFVDLLDSSKFDPKYTKRAGLQDKGYPNASLLLGGPGTGKTETVKMYAKESNSELATIKLGDFANSFVDGTATNMLNMFKAIKEKAEENPDKTYTILFDEVDGLARKLDKIGSNNEYLGKNRQSFITGLDMILPLKNIRVFATSNVSMKEIDDAVISRLKRNVTFETPNPTQSFEALKFHLKDCEGLKNNSFDFFIDQKTAIMNFLEKLYKRNGAYRDLANITQDAQAKYANVMEKAKNDTLMFDIKYLEQALKDKGIMANEKVHTNNISIKKPTILQQVKSWMHRKFDKQ